MFLMFGLTCVFPWEIRNPLLDCTVSSLHCFFVESGHVASLSCGWHGHLAGWLSPVSLWSLFKLIDWLPVGAVVFGSP